MPPREGWSRGCKKEESTSDMPPLHLLEAREAYLAPEAWGWAAGGHQGTGPGPGGPLWTRSSSASCRSRSTEWRPGHRNARGTGSRGASAARCRPSHGSTPRPAQGCIAGPAAALGHGEPPLPWWVTQGVSPLATWPTPPFISLPPSFFKGKAHSTPDSRRAQRSQTTSCPPRHCLSSYFRRLYLLACDLPLIPSLYSNKEGPTN